MRCGRSVGGGGRGLGPVGLLGGGEGVLVVAEVLGAVGLGVSKYTPVRFQEVSPMVMAKLPVSRIIGAIAVISP